MQEVVGAVGGPQAAEFQPTLLWLIVVLPLLGFVVNGLLAVVAARSGAIVGPVDRHGHGHEDPSEQEQEADDHDLHPATHDDDHHGHAARPWTHVLPSFVAPGVVAVAFLIALINYFGMIGAEIHEPIVRSYWRWMPVGDLQVDAALQLDQLSILMTLIITVVGR